MWSKEDNSENESDAEVEYIEKNFKPTYVVIAIDCHPLMFRKKECGSTPFKDCLSACYSLADSLLLKENKRSMNKFAILMAREESPCYIEFQDNLIDTVKLLKTKASLSNEQLANEFQRKVDFDLASFFLTCKKVFHDIKTPFYKRNLIYITDDDEPVQDATKKFTALNEAKTFSGNQISFQIIPTTSDFNYNKFYNELISLLENPPLEEICEDKEGLIEKLTSAVIMKHTRTKMLFYPFKDDRSCYLNCCKLNFIHALTLNNTKFTKGGKKVKLIFDNENESVDTYSLKKYPPEAYPITFDAYEKNSMSNTLPIGLTLLYASKRTEDIGYSFHKPFLLESKEKVDNFFNKFWQYCFQKERVLVCALKQQEYGKIRYTELIPITLNDSSVYLVKYIPCANEIALPKRSNYAGYDQNDEKKESLRKAVHALTFDFDIKMLPDPCYRKKKEYLKAKLLDGPMEEVNDIISNVEALDESLQEALDMIDKNYSFIEQKKRKGRPGTSRAKRTK